MHKDTKIIPGDKRLRQNLLLIVALYFLVAVLLEPAIDWLLVWLQSLTDPLALDALNRKKVFVSTISYSVLRTLPILFFFWLGYRIVASAKLPPGGMKFPFTVPLIQGRTARMFGFLLIVISIMLLYRELAILTQNAFV